MAKLSSFRRLYQQDFNQQFQPFVQAFGTYYNSMGTEVYNALSNNLTFSENLNATIGTVTLSVDANGTPAGTSTINLASYQTSVSGLWVINCVAGDGVSLPTAQPFISFKKNNNSVSIIAVKGLPASISFTLTVAIIA